MANPVTVTEACTHLRLIQADLTTEEAAQIDAFIAAATDHAENITKRILTDAEQVAYLDDFPVSRFLTIKAAPLTEIAIQYKDTSGALVTYAAGNYYTFTPYGVTRVVPNSMTFPDTNCMLGNVTITYKVDVSAIPMAIKAAILLIVGALYENREDDVIEQGIVAVKAPTAAKDLLNPYIMR
jgi:uncharacterized phiE125 gp8 family phage protein